MKAMLYEHLMRMAYQCGRNGVRGADADIYRKMELTIRQLEPPYNSTKSKEALEYESRVAIAEVRGYVEGAIKKVAMEIYDIEDRQQLAALLQNIPIIVYDPEAIDKTISAAIEIFKKHELAAR